MLDNNRAIINVGIQPGLMTVPGLSPTSASPKFDTTFFRGLIDTGAQKTLITRSTAQKVGLRPRGKIKIGNVSNIEYHNAYSFALGVWYGDDSGEDSTKGYFVFEPVWGADFKDNDDFEVLIGMDIVSQGDFRTTRTGEFHWDF